MHKILTWSLGGDTQDPHLEPEGDTQDLHLEPEGETQDPPHLEPGGETELQYKREENTTYTMHFPILA